MKKGEYGMRLIRAYPAHFDAQINLARREAREAAFSRPVSPDARALEAKDMLVALANATDTPMGRAMMLGKILDQYESGERPDDDAARELATQQFEENFNELEHVIVPEIEEDTANSERTFRIRHDCDIGNQDVYVERRYGSVDGKRAALYCQFKCEEWLGPQNMLSNLAVAALLVMFYGYCHAAVASEGNYTDIDMYSDRENACGGLFYELMADASLHHEGMREALSLLAEPC